ncbi:MAG: (2Fe-2S)-binding protein [Chloroflexi bacterium]|nr:(2Fe-2S)-binding protein [Chloroflexota bacterium]
MKRLITLTVNDQEYQLEVPAYRLLVDVLREDLELTGTKEGCGIGVCGACTVLLDGKLVSSCLTLAAKADGSRITTIEGLGKNGALHPLQRSFIEHGGFQCGFCTPGQIITAKALLDINHNPTEEEVKEWMSGNLCRCTGYYKILESILAVARA